MFRVCVCVSVGLIRCYRPVSSSSSYSSSSSCISLLSIIFILSYIYNAINSVLSNKLVRIKTNNVSWIKFLIYSTNKKSSFFFFIRYEFIFEFFECEHTLAVNNSEYSTTSTTGIALGGVGVSWRQCKDITITRTQMCCWYIKSYLKKLKFHKSLRLN